ARAIFVSLPASARESAYARQFERLGACAMAVPLAASGRRAEALAAAEAGLAMAERDAATPGAALDARLGPWMCRFLGARARHTLGDDVSAAALLEETARALRPIVAARPATMVPYVGLTETLRLLAAIRPAAQCALLDEAAATWISWPGAPTPYTR